MKRVLLVMQSAAEKKKFINTMPPLGIMYIASFLESKDMTCDLIDYNISDADYSITKDYNLVCFSVNCANITKTLHMAKQIKESYGKKIIVGGPQVTSTPRFFLDKEYIDGAVVGEGEYTLYEYIKDARPVKGLYLKDGKKIIFGGERPFIEDLDSLPFPAFNKVDIKKYNIPVKKKKPTSPIITSRGCPFRCIFCFHPLGYAFRPRSPKSVVDEIEWQVKNLGTKEICILDDNLTLDIDRAREIFERLIDKNLDVTFQSYNGMRADKVDERILMLMKKAKLWLISVSPESGDEESIKLMKKGFNKKKVKEVVRISKKLGIFTYANFMIGFPWETVRHIKNTINFSQELDADITHFSRVVAFPNTELYDMCGINYKIEEDVGLFYSNPKFNISTLSSEEINILLKEAYRKFYFNPKKLVKLVTNLQLQDIYSLFRYSLITKSI